VYTVHRAGVKHTRVRFAAIVGLVGYVRFAMVSGCARIGKDAGACWSIGRVLIKHLPDLPALASPDPLPARQQFSPTRKP